MQRGLWGGVSQTQADICPSTTFCRCTSTGSARATEQSFTTALALVPLSSQHSTRVTRLRACESSVHQPS